MYLTIRGNSKPLQPRFYFVIKYGPPASGKSQILQKCLPQLVHKPIREISINDYVEKNQRFIQKSNAIAKQKGVTQQNMKTLTNAVLNETFVQSLMNVYANVRGTKNKLHNINLNSALQKQQPVITFETAGRSGLMRSIGWLTKLQGMENYKMILIFPVVPVDVAWERYVRRAFDMFSRGQGIRLGSTQKQFYGQYINTYNNFLQEIKTLHKTYPNIEVKYISTNKSNYMDAKCITTEPAKIMIQSYLKTAKATLAAVNMFKNVQKD